MADKLSIEIVYALPECQRVLPLDVALGSTVNEAIMQSGILMICQDIDLNVNQVGIYGKRVLLSSILNQGDRIEIYRELLSDPKEIRRKRAAEHSAKMLKNNQ